MDILQMLKSGKKSAGDIAEKFSLTGATVSYHLSKLKNADLISETKYKTLDSACTSIRVMLISSINTAKGNAK